MNKIYTPIPNGRIDIINSNSKSYPFFIEKNINYTFDKNAVSNRYEYNNLQRQYFSQKNINSLQSKIRKSVYKRAKHIIHNQDTKVLKTIMKSIFLQYGKNLETDLIGQVNMLNKFVLNYSINNIISNIELYMTYRKSISYIPIPLSNPTYVSSAGTKTNKNFIY